MFKSIFVLILLIASNIKCQNEDILCSKTTCEEAVCNPVPDNCNIQNSTHNGIFLPSPEKCNCCDYCITYLGEGDPCTVGSLESKTPTSMCGPGLYCNPSTSTSPSECVQIKSTCMDQRAEYFSNLESGSVGTMQLPPNCDGDGDFDSYQCIPGQSCYCMHRNGKRLFGQIDYTGIPELIFKCTCSRMHAEAEEILGRTLLPGEFFRCTENGDYDPIQCIDEECFCVDPTDGAPTDPNANTVNSTMISRKTLDCFEDGLHTENQYYKKCEREFQAASQQFDVVSDGYDKVISYAMPKCDIDGTYHPVQENSTHKYCVDSSGDVLLALDKSDTDIEQTSLDEMNCLCIRANKLISSPEKATCDINGNYTKRQCRRGVCRCVDSNGNQVCDPSNLPCEGDISFQCT